MLIAISSGFEIDVPKFNTFSPETAKLYVEKYPWYLMSTTVHKMLIHGSYVIQKAIVPIGQLFEEALEARNKDIKKYRTGLARKTSRTQTMEDIFNRLLISSDSIISSMRQRTKKKKMRFLPQQVKELLKEPEINVVDSAEFAVEIVVYENSNEDEYTFDFKM